jgi:ubiquinone/menaquinone biosynthesis C-methylase UbiE
MTVFDQLAADYDATRGGETRGDEYAAAIDEQLPWGEGPVLEVGVGTGVVALGLRRRGRAVLGLDLSAPMLDRARSRLGPIVILSDAMRMPVANRSIAQAVSVWVVHSVRSPGLLFEEVARVLRPGGRYVVCTGQRPAADDPVGQIMEQMSTRVDARRGSARPRGVTPAQVLAWAADAGFAGHRHQFARRWHSTPQDELAAITLRTWSALRELDEKTQDEVTAPAIEALQALPQEECVRRGIAEMIVLEHL